MENYENVVVLNLNKKHTIYTYLKSLGYSENFLRNLRKKEGYIKLNDEVCFINVYVKNSDKISIYKSPNNKTNINLCIIPLDIVYEDDDILIINKPANLSTMPSRSHFNNNLSGAILYYMQKKDENFVVRIVNRLDKEVAGLVICAKNSLACNFLNIKENTKKEYFALCEGLLKKDIIIKSKIKTTKNKLGYNNQKRESDEKEGKSATTNVCVVKNFNDFTLCKIVIDQGRTHQIRVHMQSINHALLGDSLYAQKTNLINHTALICKKISLIHPCTKKQMHFEIDFDDNFKNLIWNKV